MAFTTLPFSLLGFRVMGDVAGYTCYTDRYGRKVYYKKAPPDKPPSGRQALQRRRFQLAVAAWKSLTDAEKHSLEEACRRSSLCLTGQNLYTSCSLRGDFGTYATIEEQPAIQLPPLVFIP